MLHRFAFVCGSCDTRRKGADSSVADDETAWKGEAGDEDDKT
jgi:hypothetical protein